MLKFKVHRVSVSYYDIDEIKDYVDSYSTSMGLTVNDLLMTEKECQRICMEFMNMLATTNLNFSFSVIEHTLLTEAEKQANAEAEAALLADDQ